jgi:excisionase family DNA binding protein
VAELVASHLAADEPPAAIAALKGAPVGRVSLSRAAEVEVLTLEQLADLLSLDIGTAQALAEAGEFPGRKLGDEWRFSRRAIIDWLRGE